MFLCPRKGGILTSLVGAAGSWPSLLILDEVPPPPPRSALVSAVYHHLVAVGGTTLKPTAKP